MASSAMRAALRNAISLLLVAAALAACDPFGLPSTRALENGATSMLTSATSFEVKGSYRASDVAWTIDLQLTRHADAANDLHMLVSDSQDQVEAIIVGTAAYYRGQQFLARHLTDPQSQGLVKDRKSTRLNSSHTVSSYA